jgi:ABC-type transport system involved in multi-copper enzyme maturation permease subunit
MSTTTPAASPNTINATEGRSGLASFPRLLAMEWTKLRSVRSTLWSFGIMIVAVLGFTALFTALTVSQWNKADASQRAATMLDPAGQILGSGFFLGQLAICVLGVMVITSEYSTGMIRASVLAVPKRIPMLAAKCVVFALTVFVVGEFLSFGAFFIGAPILRSKVPVALGDPGVLRAVIGGGLYLTVLGLFALAIGALVRHTAGGITGIIGFVLVLAPLAQLLPGSLGKHIHAYLPTEAGHLIAQSHQGTKDLLTPVQGFGVFLLWTAVALIAAGVLLKRRDA